MLSVDLRVLDGACLLLCRGEVVGGKEADYLFNLITRDEKRDVVLDFGGVNKVDQEGVSVLSAGYEFLTRMGRRLSLKKPSAELVLALRECKLDAIIDLGQQSMAQTSSAL